MCICVAKQSRQPLERFRTVVAVDVLHFVGLVVGNERNLSAQVVSPHVAITLPPDEDAEDAGPRPVSAAVVPPGASFALGEIFLYVKLPCNSVEKEE